MSVFQTLFSPFGKWKENPERPKTKETQSEKLQTIDRIEEVETTGIEEINIHSNANVIITTADSKVISIRIHGISTTNYEVDAYATQIEKTLRINAKGKVIGQEPQNGLKEQNTKNVPELNDELSFANITLEVGIPAECAIRRIKIKNSNGNIICKSTINADFIEVRNKNGNMEIMSTFTCLQIDSKRGNIQVKSKANSDLKLDIKNGDGVVTVSLENIQNCYMQYEVAGAVLIHPKYQGEYNVYGNIHVSNGNFVLS